MPVFRLTKIFLIICLIMSIFTIVGLNNVQAVPIFNDDFETWVSSTGGWDWINYSAGPVSTTTEHSKSGSVSLKCVDTSTTTRYSFIQKNFPPEPSVYTRFYFYLDTGYYTNLAGGQHIKLFKVESTNDYRDITFATNKSLYGNVMFVQANVSNDGAYPATTLNENTWYSLEILAPVPTGSSTIRWWLDGTEMQPFNEYLNDAGGAWKSVQIGIVEEYDVSIITGTVYIDGVVISTTYVGPIGYYTDTTGPLAPQIRDGTGLSDIMFIDSLTELSANWDAVVDPESGITNYHYTIGTTVGGTDITGWTDNRVSRSVTKSGLNLIVATTYYISVRAENNRNILGDVGTSDGQYMKETHPIISNVGYSDITQTGIIITWVTDEGSTSQVFYGTTDIYGSTTTETTSLTTNHAVALGGLSPGVTYYFKVKSTDSLGTPSISSNSIFITLAEPPLNPADVLERAFPNPFRPSQDVEMKFYVFGSKGATLKIYTIRNKVVKTIIAAGEEKIITWDGSNEEDQLVGSGIYLYIIEDELGKQKGKFILIR